ncbi:unnamed protein product [Arctia plantaginis]|uniref:Nucleic-acid-binding protein from mobile element jockey n=1 Tax=Arctia plantaginis TaxID=874455 RepID=A0A8S1A630_ARCPL|nr:unnamed protein product [Arctia plantaginis]
MSDRSNAIEDRVEYQMTRVNSTNLVNETEDRMECSDRIQANEEVEESRLNKRTREDNSSEEWNTVYRRNKVVRRDSQEVQDKFQVSVTHNTALPKQFALARLFTKNNIKGIERIKYVHQNKILITFECATDADDFIGCKEFTELGWRSQKTSEVGISYGIIKNVELDLSEADILKCLSSDYDIVSVKRLNKRNNIEPSSTSATNHNWIESETIRLGFRTSSLPGYVYIEQMRVKVEPYIFPVTQCSRCWKFGHAWRMCPSKKVVCPKCTKGHENCDTTSYKCVNCTGNHMALQKSCPLFKKERRIRELMSEFNCTYRKALSIYVPPSPIPKLTGPNKLYEEDKIQSQRITVSESTHVNNQHDRPESERLFSQLFTSIADQPNSTQSRRKKKRQRAPTPLPPPPSSSAADCRETNWNKEASGFTSSDDCPRVEKETHTIITRYLLHFRRLGDLIYLATHKRKSRQ